MDSAAGWAANPGDGPSLVCRFAAQNGPDRPAARFTEDESVVGAVDFGRLNLNDLVTGDLAVLWFKHHANLEGWY